MAIMRKYNLLKIRYCS